MSIEPSDRLEHILEETKFLIEVRTNLRSQEDIMNDEVLKRAIVRSLEIIGEATKNLPEQLRKQNTQIDWKNIARMRDNLIHRYFGINYDLVWEVLKYKIPQLQETVEKILQVIYREEYLVYKRQVNLRSNTVIGNQNNIDSYRTIDLKIANLIVNEYQEDFRETARAKIKRILSQSDYVLQSRQNNASKENYWKSIIDSVTSELTDEEE
jgi:uncharacterized protein with HEPN domain